MEFLFKIILLLSKLPLKILYLISDFLFFLLYYVVGYRKQVVFRNIKNSFPEKSDQEVHQISKKFYRNFADYLAEMAKSFTISSNELRVRVQHINQDVFADAKNEGKNVIMLAGHVFNWEWFSAFATAIPQEHSYPVYRKMQSPFWEKKIKQIRDSYGNHSVEASDVMRHILKNPNDGNSVYMFVADQSPYVLHVNYGLTFLNQKTPVFVGYDKLATRMDLAFIYCDMKKVKRGFYQVNYYRIEPDGERFQDLEIVKKFHESLEQTIKKNPDNYLWSHKKWKYADQIKTMV